ATIESTGDVGADEVPLHHIAGHLSVAEENAVQVGGDDVALPGGQPADAVVVRVEDLNASQVAQRGLAISPQANQVALERIGDRATVEEDAIDIVGGDDVVAEQGVAGAGERQAEVITQGRQPAGGGADPVAIDVVAHTVADFHAVIAVAGNEVP